MNSNNWVSVSTPYITPRASGAPDAWTEEAASRGGRGTNRLAFTGETPALPFVAEAFGIDEGAAVIARRRIVYLNEAPVEIATSYYPPRIASGTALELPRKIKGGSITLLAELGYTTVRVTEEVFAQDPTDDERSDLQLTEGEVVITIHRVNCDGDGTPFQVEIMTAPAKARRLRYEMEVG